MQTAQSFVTNDTNVLFSAQRDLELRASKDGYKRYIKAQDTAQANLGGHATSEATKIIKGCIPLVSAKITEWVSANDKEGAGKRHQALKYLKSLDPDLLAFLSLNCVFGVVIDSRAAIDAQSQIGQQVEAEIIQAAIEAHQGKKVAARIAAQVSKQGSSRNKIRSFQKLARSKAPEHKPWEQEIRIRVAEPLLNAVLEALPDIFELITLPIKKNDTRVCIRLTNEALGMFMELRESMGWMSPIHRPMVIPPRPWTSFDTGCYYEERTSRTVQLVRTFNADHKKLLRTAIRNGEMDFVLKAVNTIQGTAWSINQDILELVEWCYENGIEGLGVARNKLLDVPHKLPEETWEAMTPEQRKGYRLRLSGIHERNRGILSDKEVLTRDLDTAKELTKYAQFWLPHNLDFRGRVYPVPHFNHQRADPIKAMFLFAEGFPLGTYGAGWLSIHLANCGDFEKVSKGTFDERLDWVDRNELMILQIAKDPKGTVDLWREADSPFMFVAACLEYARWVQEGRSDDFISHIPVALDGSNSGLQHYSAALRSQDEAALVSLTDSERPADLYQTVADKVLVNVTKEAGEGNSLASVCLKAGVTRSLVKRNVMTFAYSSEQFGFRQQLMSDLMKPLSDEVFMGLREAHPYAVPRVDKETGKPLDEMDGGFAAAGYLASKVWQAVTETVTKATEGMVFFKKLASTLAHEKQPLIWHTPLGMPVVHKYSVWETKRLELVMYDRSIPVACAGSKDQTTIDGEGVLRRVRLNINTKPTTTIDKAKARSAVAPNVIHSMDGSHLMLTVLNAEAEGFMDFALIHDSFGTHAGKTHRFFEIIRESFVEMYSDYCPFEECLEYAKSVLSPDGVAKLPEIPFKGSMGLNQVLNAQYAFA